MGSVNDRNPMPRVSRWGANRRPGRADRQPLRRGRSPPDRHLRTRCLAGVITGRLGDPAGSKTSQRSAPIRVSCRARTDPVGLSQHGPTRAWRRAAAVRALHGRRRYPEDRPAVGGQGRPVDDRQSSPRIRDVPYRRGPARAHRALQAHRSALRAPGHRQPPDQHLPKAGPSSTPATPSPTRFGKPEPPCAAAKPTKPDGSGAPGVAPRSNHPTRQTRHYDDDRGLIGG